MKSPISSSDLRERARRRLPKFAFDYLDGGAGSEAALARSVDAFKNTCITPRVLVNSAARAALTSSFLGETWALPFGIAPLGLPSLAWPGADLALAQAAKIKCVPYTCPTPATMPLEQVAGIGPPNILFQLYVGSSPEITEDLMARAERAGCTTLVVTADVPRSGKRLRDMRNGFGLPLRLGATTLWELARHPRWSLATLRHGAPRLANLAPYAAPGANARTLAEVMSAQSSGRLDWEVFSAIRERWAGRLVLKGVLDPSDALRAVAAGADAVQVSSHGGRQLDSAPAPLHALAKIRAALPPRFPVAFDGGVRSGEDILKALEAGADFVFVGRPLLYGLGALGAKGPEAVLDMLAGELEAAMAMTGRRSVAEIVAARQSPPQDCDLTLS